MRQLLRTVFAGSAAVGITGTLSPVVSALSLVDERAIDPLLYLWARSVLLTAGVKTEARGLERLPPGNFVLAVNHQSHFDAMMLYGHLTTHLRFVAKADLFKIPLFGGRDAADYRW